MYNFWSSCFVGKIIGVVRLSGLYSEDIIDKMFFFVFVVIFWMVLKLKVFCFVFYCIFKVWLIGSFFKFKLRFFIEGVWLDFGIDVKIFWWLFNYFVNWKFFFFNNVGSWLINCIVLFVEVIDLR